MVKHAADYIANLQADGWEVVGEAIKRPTVPLTIGSITKVMHGPEITVSITLKAPLDALLPD